MKRLLLLLFIVLWTLFGSIILNHQDMRLYAMPRISHDPADFNFCNTVMVLGAGRNYAYSHPNYSFIGRMDACVHYMSYHPGDFIVLSGYSDHDLYNEPLDMLQVLRRGGISSLKYSIDDQCIDTYTSIQRFSKQFGGGPVVLISEPEHLRRAIWMASWAGIDAYGYTAKGYPGGTPRWFRIREYLASVKARLRVMGFYKTVENE